MCPEVLNLLAKAEIILNMTIDEESPESRLPIPLIYRPLRQFMYGVLFGTNPNNDNKDIIEDEKESESRDTEDEPLVNGNSNVGKDDNTKEEEKEDESKVENTTKKEDACFIVKEWCVYGNNSLETPDNVTLKG